MQVHSSGGAYVTLAQLAGVAGLGWVLLRTAFGGSWKDNAKWKLEIIRLRAHGSSYIADDLAVWLKAQGMVHVRGAPNHPQTQGKIKRWHQTLKNSVLLENYYLPGDLEAGVGAFVEHYNHRRYHESLGNLTPADLYFDQHHAIIERRRKVTTQV